MGCSTGSMIARAQRVSSHILISVQSWQCVKWLHMVGFSCGIRHTASPSVGPVLSIRAFYLSCLVENYTSCSCRRNTFLYNCKVHFVFELKPWRDVPKWMSHSPLLSVPYCRLKEHPVARRISLDTRTNLWGGTLAFQIKFCDTLRL